MDLSLKDVYQIVSSNLPEDGPHKLNKDYVVFHWKDRELFVRMNKTGPFLDDRYNENTAYQRLADALYESRNMFSGDVKLKLSKGKQIEKGKHHFCFYGVTRADLARFLERLKSIV